MIRAIRRFNQNISGATAIEYGLIAGLIACVIIQAITTIGTKLQTEFHNINNAL